jgi:hypothetical protein
MTSAVALRDVFAVSVVAGSGQQGYSEGVGVEARFGYPFGIAYQYDAKTKTSRLFVADQVNHRLRTVELPSGSSNLLLLTCICIRFEF